MDCTPWYVTKLGIACPWANQREMDRNNNTNIYAKKHSINHHTDNNYFRRM